MLRSCSALAWLALTLNLASTTPALAFGRSSKTVISTPDRLATVAAPTPTATVALDPAISRPGTALIVHEYALKNIESVTPTGTSDYQLFVDFRNGRLPTQPDSPEFVVVTCKNKLQPNRPDCLVFSRLLKYGLVGQRSVP